eukprot:evm.model.scf_453.6 EVM.evm.TU.scf_453.6   scf_453:50700-52576(+)
MGLSRSLWAAAALAALLVGRADGACVEEWESEGTALPPADQVSRLPYQLRTLLQLGQGGFALAPEAFPPFAGPFPNQAGTFNNQAGGAGFQSQSPSLLEYILLRIQAYRNKPRVPLVQRVANFFGGGGVTGNVVNVLDNF